MHFSILYAGCSSFIRSTISLHWPLIFYVNEIQTVWNVMLCFVANHSFGYFWMQTAKHWRIPRRDKEIGRSNFVIALSLVKVSRHKSLRYCEQVFVFLRVLEARNILLKIAILFIRARNRRKKNTMNIDVRFFYITLWFTYVSRGSIWLCCDNQVVSYLFFNLFLIN